MTTNAEGTTVELLFLPMKVTGRCELRVGRHVGAAGRGRLFNSAL